MTTPDLPSGDIALSDPARGIATFLEDPRHAERVRAMADEFDLAFVQQHERDAEGAQALWENYVSLGRDLLSCRRTMWDLVQHIQALRIELEALKAKVALLEARDG